MPWKEEMVERPAREMKFTVPGSEDNLKIQEFNLEGYLYVCADVAGMLVGGSVKTADFGEAKNQAVRILSNKLVQAITALDRLADAMAKEQS